jgi:hypothetical protein
MLLERKVENLEKDEWYMFMVIPVTKESGGGHVFEGSSDFYRKKDDVKVDLRAFKLCKWNSGCEESFH